MENLWQRRQKSQLLVVDSKVWSCFPGSVLNQKIHFAVLISKSSFNFLGVIMKYQKYSKSKALHEIGEVLCYPKDQMASLEMDWQSNKQFAQIIVY